MFDLTPKETVVAQSLVDGLLSESLSWLEAQTAWTGLSIGNPWLKHR